MPVAFEYYYDGTDRRKPWRYPGVEIPFRLRHKYREVIRG